MPASPPTNIELDMNEISSSPEYTLGSQKTSAQHRTDTEVVSKQLFKPAAAVESANAAGKKSGTKVAANLDKWLKELKSHILSEFEKTRANICQEHQKKLLDERER